VSDQPANPFTDPQGAQAMVAALTKGEDETRPFTPLGCDEGGRYWFTTPSGMLRSFAADQLAKQPHLAALAEGCMRWFWRNYEKITDRGPALNLSAIQEELVRQCVAAGYFDPAAPMRGPGTWDAQGRIIVHAGDALLVEEESAFAWTPPGQRYGEALYTAKPAIKRPGEAAASTNAGADILATLWHWRWADPIAPELVLGWMGAALLGAATEWRSHIGVEALRGAGKSLVAQFVSRCLGGMSLGVKTDVSAAYLQQALTGQSRALLLDESETTASADADGGPMARIIKLLRHMSGGEGASGGRGSSGGVARTYHVAAPCYLSGIVLPPLGPQDRTRITVVKLLPLMVSVLPAEEMAEREKAFRDAMDRCAAQAPALWRRAIEHARRFPKLLSRYRAALLSLGGDVRNAAQLGALLAGRDLLTRDDLPSEAEARAEAARVAHLIQEAQVDAETENEGQECLSHLLTTPVDLFRKGTRETLGAILAQACEAEQFDKRKALGTYGLRLEWDARQGRVVRLAIANAHTGLGELFNGTRWARGGWRSALLYLPGATVSGPVRFGAVLARGVALPPSLIPGPDEKDTFAEGGEVESYAVPFDPP
jgi:hypothetical protein